MRWILRLAWFLALATLAALIGFFLRRDPGLVLVRFHGFEVDTSVVFLMIAAIVVAALLYGLYVLVVRLPRFWRHGRRTKATTRLDEGLVLSYAGQLYAAQRALLAASPEPVQRLSALLSAADVAQRRGEIALVDEILRNAAKLDRGVDIAAVLGDVWRAERGEEEAFLAVGVRAEKADAPPVVLRAYIEGLLKRRRAADAVHVLERLGSLRQIGDREFAALELRVLAAALEQAPDRETLDALWKRFGKVERRDLIVLRALVCAESRVGSRNLAAEAIEAALAKEWSEPLAEVYASAPVESASARIKRAEAMLPKHPSSPGLLLALARWCRLSDITGKAQDYLRLSLSANPRIEALTEAAQLFESRGESERAKLAWRLAAESALGKKPADAELTSLLR